MARPNNVLEFLETINDPEIRELAIGYAKAHGVEKFEGVYTVHDAVAAIRWYETDEGSHFWRQVCNDLSLGFDSPLQVDGDTKQEKT